VKLLKPEFLGPMIIVVLERILPRSHCALKPRGVTGDGQKYRGASDLKTNVGRTARRSARHLKDFILDQEHRSLQEQLRW
jgi:hypothetical protein